MGCGIGRPHNSANMCKLNSRDNGVSHIFVPLVLVVMLEPSVGNQSFPQKLNIVPPLRLKF